MKFFIYGQPGLVTGAFAIRTAAGLEVVVRLSERGAWAHIKGGSTNHPLGNAAMPLDYDTYAFYSSEHDAPLDDTAPNVELVVQCETEEEHQLMTDGLRFEATEKDHFSVLYVPRKLLVDSSLLGEATF